MKDQNKSSEECPVRVYVDDIYDLFHFGHAYSLEQAKKLAKEKLVCSEVKFKEDGSAEIVFGPMNPVRKYGGRRVWFNTIVNYTSADVGNISFADGSQLPETAVEAYKKITEDNCVDIKWQKGDLLLLDNLHSQHARRPGKPPRAILVSQCNLE